MSELGAAGAAATAGLIAGAIERKGGAGEGPPAPGQACLNCGAGLAGAYCHVCGQPARISRTLGDVIHDVLHAFLHLDTKAWRTFPQLVMRPGTMTHAYIHGQRAKYVSPLALFLFTVFLMFFVASVIGGPVLGPESPPDGPVAERVLDVPAAQAAVAAAQERRDEAVAAFAKAEAEAAALKDEGSPGAGGAAIGIVAGAKGSVQAAENRLQRAKARLALAQANEASKAAQAQDAPADAAKGEGVSVTVDVGEAGTATIEQDRDDRPWQEQLREAVEDGEVTVNTGFPEADARILAQLRNPDLALYKLQETASKFSFLLVPISLPFIALLFLWKRGVTLFDHVVVSLYSLSFMSVLFVLLGLIGSLGEPAALFVASAATLIPPVHIFFHLKGAYGLKVWSALWRTVLLLIFITFTISLFAIAILLLGLLA